MKYLFYIVTVKLKHSLPKLTKAFNDQMFFTFTGANEYKKIKEKELDMAGKLCVYACEAEILAKAKEEIGW